MAEFRTIGDFIERTIENLALIKHKTIAMEPGMQAHEVTQLINSLALPLELLVNKKYVLTKPRDNFNGARTLRQNLDDKVRKPWPEFATITGKEPTTLSKWAEVLRNAAAHFNVEFEKSASSNEITSVVMWDKDHEGKTVTWKGRIPIGKLHPFVEAFLKAVSESELGDVLIAKIEK